MFYKDEQDDLVKQSQDGAISVCGWVGGGECNQEMHLKDFRELVTVSQVQVWFLSIFIRVGSRARPERH